MQAFEVAELLFDSLQGISVVLSWTAQKNAALQYFLQCSLAFGFIVKSAGGPCGQSLGPLLGALFPSLTEDVCDGRRWCAELIGLPEIDAGDLNSSVFLWDRRPEGP